VAFPPEQPLPWWIVTAPADWQPFSTRVLRTSTPDDTLYEGVPMHLEGPLRRWLDQVVTDDLAERVNLRLRRVGGMPLRAELVHVDTSLLLDVVDAVLFLGSSTYPPVPRGDLANRFDDSGSAYRLSADMTGLERE
jgi:hypothetical protein